MYKAVRYIRKLCLRSGSQQDIKHIQKISNPTKPVVSEKTTFPRLLCPLQSSSRKAKCACAARRGSGIMASWTRYGRRRREVEMYIFLCMVSNITLSVAFRYFCKDCVAYRFMFYFTRGVYMGLAFEAAAEVERWREH